MIIRLRDVPETELSQYKFTDVNRGTCIQISQRVFRTKSDVDQYFDRLILNRDQARKLAQELILFAENREIKDES